MNKQLLLDELKKAMLERNAMKTSVLRMLKSALGYYEIEKGGANYEATEEDMMQVLEKQIKQRRDSIEQFTNAGRAELAAKETEELTLLQAYMPAQLSEDEVKQIVTDTIAHTGATTKAEMGKVMGALMPKVKGKADGTLVSRIVRESLI